MAEPPPSQPKNTETISVDDLCLLANSFAEQFQYDKALQLYESACRLFPQNLALKINLGRIKNLKNQSLESPSDILPPKQQEKQNDYYFVNRYQGLGEIFLKNGRKEEARQIFELFKVHNQDFYLPYLYLGKLYMAEANFSRAIQELEQARKLNPFHEEVVEVLSAAYVGQREYKEALECIADAFVLSGESKQEKSEGYREKIQQIMQKVTGFTKAMRNELIKQRRNRIHALYEDLQTEVDNISKQTVELQKKQISDENVSSEIEEPSVQEISGSSRDYDMAALMKKQLIFRNMNDEDVMKLARFTTELRVLKGDYVYKEGDPIYGLYFIARGKIELQKTTPYGPIVFATFEKGSFFGDDNLLSGRERFTSAIASQECDLLFLDKAGLATIFARERAIAIHFLWYFWKSLSIQVRESNDRMTSFFSVSSEDARKKILEHDHDSYGGKPTHIEIDKKMEVLQTKGLTSTELGHIARLSNEEIYNAGETIFCEGDIGDRLYIVLQGQVLISKQIPGVGEEALAVLKKGDFFGEMALAGQHHIRSADAKAKEQGTTLLVISREVLREILSIDTHSAYQFLAILCRILSQRLLEINEKIYQWRMMSGSF